MKLRALLSLLIALLQASAAIADETSFCPERPGQTTPPCVIETGRVAIETAAASWTNAHDDASKTTSYIFGDTVVRVGVMPGFEAQVGWTPVGYVRSRDDASGAITRSTQLGDVKIGLLYAPGSPGAPVALQGFLSLPTGRDPIGAQDWGVGLRLPVALSVDALQFALTPEVDGAVNSSGSGRHLAYGSAAGVGYSVTDTVQLGVDIAVFRDEELHGSTVTSGLSVAWQASGTLQFDAGEIIGLNRNSPDFQIYVGVAHLF